ncbi:MAG: hypothetical protein JWM58_487 [Rhizobium sp.]|nr:hypothetical protein [Rhizobium sp.]
MGKSTRMQWSLPITARFMVGRDNRGYWTVSNESGLIGGPFSDRTSAIHFAMTRSEYAPGAVQCLPDDVTISVDPLFHVGRKALPPAAGRRL